MTAPLRPHLDELVPVVRRAVALDPDALVRLRAERGTLTLFAALPFRVLVSRTVQVHDDALERVDATLRGADLLAWHDEAGAPEPVRRDADWRGTLPPVGGWSRLDRVPDSVVRELVRSGALALKDAAAREGVPGAQPRAEVADALLDAVVLTVTDDSGRAAGTAGAAGTARVTLRTISALVRMGFVARGSQVAVDRAARWTRLAGTYGAAYDESTALGLLR